ncbi:MAG: 3-methyl-2-oxobutanoate hydroxymethyltransferase [Firmicutes bacterium]|nr:3-methyl-2-oxobutanoate hydroxymethyltransferase [Bacillota bacterium]
MARNTVNTLLKLKQEGKKISQVTCYDYSTARLVDAAGIDTILVGDSLGMVMQGYENTLPVTMEEMIIYGRSVVRGAQNAFVVIDMPFMSYQCSVEQAVMNAGRLIKETGANAVKLEGGVAVAPQIKAIVDSGIPVCGHIGMTPQSCNLMSGFKVQGKSEANAERIMQDAFAVQEAGAFMMVIECVPPKLSALISKKMHLITIGIGAGAGCDGQVLVNQDMTQMNGDFLPKFCKHFGNVGDALIAAYKAYDEEVKAGTFPDEQHSFPKSECPEEFLKVLDERY